MSLLTEGKWVWTNKLQQSLATIWHCLLQPFYISLPLPPLHLLFKLWWWLPDAPSPGQPSSFLPWRVCWWGQQNSHLLVFAGRILFPTTFANRAPLRFSEKWAPLNVERSRPTVSTEFGFHCCFHGWLLPIAFHSCYWIQSTPHIIHSLWPLGLKLLGCIGPFLLLCLC